jgi:hypothetical protein
LTQDDIGKAVQIFNEGIAAVKQDLNMEVVQEMIRSYLVLVQMTTFDG